MTFIRTVEDFVCGHCGVKVIGDGYTNHCPSCLWSKHVDIDPGDRKESCHGLMEPIGVELFGQETKLIQKCENCGLVRKNRTGDKDSNTAIVAVSNKIL
ncbi:MAG: RNHCP domain-containing protein [Candidatus Vogelbacteria bacterium]|nr:RNHCP domain-containing protein [Candidatus Vogelbacteria bacterium]